MWRHVPHLVQTYATWVPIFTAGTLVMVPKYDPDEVVRALAEHRVSIFAGGSRHLHGSAAQPVVRSRGSVGIEILPLRRCAMPGGPASRMAAAHGLSAARRLGMSEGAPFCLNRYDGERKLLSVGNPVPETEVEVVDLETGTRVLPVGEAGEVGARAADDDGCR